MTLDRPILLLALGETMVWAGLYYVFPAMLLHWEADLGWSKAQLTLGITLAVFASALAAPVAGRLIDRGFGPIQIGLATALGGVALMAVSTVSHPWQFYALWLVIGLCLAGCLYEPCFAMVTRARGAEAKRGIIWITLMAGFAGSVSFPISHILAEALGWRMALVVLGGFVSLVVAPLLFMGARALGDGAAQPKGGKNRQTVTITPVYVLLGLGFALIGLAHGAIIHHLLPLLAERGVAAQTGVLVAALVGPMQVVGRLCMVAAQSRVSTHAVVLATYASLAGAVLLLFFGGQATAGLALFVVLFGAAYGTISILRPVIARELLGEANFGAKSGGLALMYLCATASSAYFGAILWGLGGYALMLAVLLVCLALGALSYGAARRLNSA